MRRTGRAGPPPAGVERGTKSPSQRLRGGLLGLVIALLLALPAVAAGEGVIDGKLVNKTPGGKWVGGTELTLHTYQGGTEKGQAKVNTDSEGLYRFSGLDTGPEFSYDITLTYQEADYSTEQVSFQTDPTLSQEIDVYDATSSPQDIKISQSHTVITTQGSEIVVLEMYVLENTGVHTYVGSQIVPTLNRKETVRFSLPKGAGPVTGYSGLTEWGLYIQGETMTDTMPIPPGTRQIAFSYPVSGQKNILFQKTFDFPTDSFNLLVEDKGFKVEAPGLYPAEPGDIQGVRYLQYDAPNIPSGTTIAFTISGLPTAGMGARMGALLQWALVGALAVALGAGLVYSLRRRPAPARVPEESRKDLLLAIASLDDDFEASKVPEARYRRLRAELMARLPGSH